MKELKVSKTDIDLSEDYFDNPVVYKLNMPVLQAYKTLGVINRKDFESKLEKLGATYPYYLAASREDIEDYKKIGNWMPEIGPYCGPEGEEDFYGEVLGCLGYMIYKDFQIEENGKFGLKCTTGEIVVPPLFDSCAGSNEMLFCDTLAVVEKDGKQWLTHRDGSGKVVSEGYDSISRSYCFGWLENEGKKGLIDTITAHVLVPCEMDWMEGSSSGNWLIGKDDKIGFILGGFTGSDTSYIKPEYEMLDLSTGQVCKDGNWGWIVDDYGFTNEIPKFRDLRVLIWPDFPFNSYDRKYWDIKHYLSKYDSGFKIPRIKRFGATPKECLKLPILELSGKDIPIKEDVKNPFEEAFDKLKSSGKAVFTIKDNNGADFIITLTNGTDKRYDINISWKEEKQENIAVDEAFPIIMVCHRRLSLKNNKPMISYELSLSSNDLELPMKFICSLMNFRDKCTEYDEDEWSGLNAIRKVASDEEPEGWLTPEQLKEKLHQDFEEIRKAMEEDE